jgi:CubicO group peptidase (beta-lactamase class C family)
LESRVQDEPERPWSVDAAIERARTELNPIAAPGERTFYSDTNYLLLGKVIERVTGMPLAAAYDDLLFQPMGLVQTRMATGADRPQFVASVFRRDVDITPSRANPLYWADGGLVSTPREMIAFLRGLRKQRLASARALAAMHEWHAWRFPIRYGLGTMLFELPPITARLTGIPPLWGHSGSTGSFLYYCEELDLYLAGTVDQTDGQWKPFDLIREVLGVLTTDSANASPQASTRKR